MTKKLGTELRPYRTAFSHTRSKAIAKSTPVGLLAALLAIAIPSFPAHAVDIRSVETPGEYEVCAQQLQRAGVSSNELSTACAEALRPTDLSRCVLKIKLRTPIAPSSVLSACSQVRRPPDLSTCVLEITGLTKDAVPQDVLNYCRRSLLPVNFASCVVALNRKVDISATKALDTCTAADYLPDSPYRTYVPIALPPVRLEPSSVVPSVTQPQTTPTSP